MASAKIVGYPAPPDRPGEHLYSAQLPVCHRIRVERPTVINAEGNAPHH